MKGSALGTAVAREGVGCRRWLLACGVLLLVGLAGCVQRGPACTLDIQGHVQSLSTSGSILIGDYLGNKTYTWDWGDLRKPAQVFDRGSALAVGLLGPRYVFAELPAGANLSQPAIILQQRQPRQPIRQWPFDANWYCSDFVGSFDGRCMGVLLEESNPTGGDTSMGLVWPGSNEVAWVPAKGRMVRPEQAGDPMAVSRDGRYIAVLGLGDIRALVVADTAGKRVAWRRVMPRSRSLSFSADGRILYVGGHYGIYAMMADTGRPLSAWSAEDSKNAPSPIARIAASPDKRFVAAGTDSPQGEVILYDAYTGREVTRWSVARKKTQIEGIAFSPSGKFLATADQFSQSVQVWNMPQPARAAKSR